ncbi:Rec8 like protein-domain-containing protein [Fomitopsis serialis]|uniref:Rec8 like protein-domain-containing protein n=1 Tax=Fomitopsis serialis TaxID=139415 RepID=UPI002007CE37|nr:Rec8 like protein-domain-containing protein [Neoantrodia serialis]KAH9937716.1 Rec8 like protein-domain-containing protein [Neoantrodia serialis]
MFFTPELLERRESGFGLLWLAATLGAKSSFKKLPKRSILTADISQLCGLIAEPPEPLALRLSSNLMIGVARQQEIFYSDVTTCYNTLKKAVTELHTASLGAAELQAGQASLRPDVLTLAMDPGAAFAIDFGNIFGVRITEESDDEFDPKAKKAKGKQKAREKPPSLISENIRANLHTLDEYHEHLLSQSFDASFSGTGFGAPMSASQMEAGFAFSDDVFGLQDGMDLGGDIGDELARELGEGWGGPADRGGDDLWPDGSVIVPLMPFSPVQTVEGEDVEMRPNPDDPLQAGAEVPNKPQRKPKRVRLLLDARTELTDEELKAARANYVEGQETIRQELIHKKFEKDSGKIIEELIWGVPSGLQAPALVDFWTENFKLQVEARSGPAQDAQPPHKRRRIAHEEFQEGNALDEGFGAPPDTGLGMDVDMGFTIDNNEPVGFGGDYDSRMRSSEEPGVARRVSRAPSLIGSQFEMPGAGQDFVSGSQRSALFPWDNAGASSSVAGGPLDFGKEGSARPSFGRADTRLRGSSLNSRHGSPLPGGRVPESPADFGAKSSYSGEGFEFDVPGEESMVKESQLSDMNLLTLERNSHNFLEYAKMQLQTFSSATSTLTFDDVVPKQTSTPHVAAAAFYHCLVLATKDLVQVAQEMPYGTLRITVK